MENTALKVLAEKLLLLATMENGMELKEGMLDLVVYNLTHDYNVDIDAPATEENVLALISAVEAWITDTTNFFYFGEE